MIITYSHIKKTAVISMLFLILFGISSCTDNFDEINTKKDVLTSGSMNESLLGYMFAYTQYRGMAATMFQVTQNLYADMYSQYFAITHPNFNSGQLLEVGLWTRLAWDYFMKEAPPQLFYIENYAREHNMQVAYAIAEIWKVEMYHRWTDYFGPIIYSHFGNGETSVPYDTQEDVYHSFFLTLDSAAQILKQNAGGNAYGDNDQLYSGDADQWYLFANSLKLRLAMRLAYIEPDFAKQMAEEAVRDGVIESNENSALLLSVESDSRNLLSRITYHKEFAMSTTMESVLKGYDDPRISVYFDEAEEGGGYHGVRNGLPAVEKTGSLNFERSFVSRLYTSYSYAGTDTRNLVLTAPEVAFLRAEGALRGWNMGGTAKEFYNRGIFLSLTDFRMKKMGVNLSAADIDAYINNTNTPAPVADKWNTPPMTDIPVKFDESGDFERKLEQIITQKWLAIYPDGWESWSERRRTGYPRGYAVINSLNPDIPVTGLVRRLTFSSSEFANNKVAVEEAITLLANGPNEITTRLWWDAKPLSDYKLPTQ